MSYKIRCSIKLCKNYMKPSKKKTRSKILSFHRMPKDPTIASKWIDIIRKSLRDDTWTPTSSSVVCSDHFRKKDLTIFPNLTVRLRFGAVPTKALFLSAIRCDISDSSDEDECLQDTSSGVQKLSKIPEGKLFIAQVYRFLEEEFNEVLKFTGYSPEVTLFCNIQKRTAEATGFSEDTVASIMETFKRSADPKLEEPALKKPKLSHNLHEDDVSSVEEASESEGENDVELDDTSGQQDEDDDIETLMVEYYEDDEEVISVPHTITDNPQYVIKFEPVEQSSQSSISVQVTADATPTQVKTEPSDDEHDHAQPQNSISNNAIATKR